MEQEPYSIADANALNRLKHKLREVVVLLDQMNKVYPLFTIEAREVRNEAAVLLAELQTRNLYTQPNGH